MFPTLLALLLTAPVDPSALEALDKRAGELDTDALIVVQDGKLLLERWYDGKPRRIESMSVTKSIVGLAIGRMITKGELTVKTRVSEHFPEWRQGRKRQITVEQLLQQTSGLQADKMTGTEIYGNPNFVQLALCAELATDPGTKFFYNNKAANLLPGLVKNVAGRRLDKYLRSELFAPLGITDFGWTLDPAGNPHGMSGLQIRPRDLAKLGELMINEGSWNGEQLVDAAFIRAAATPSPHAEWYGYLWWLELRKGEVAMLRADGWQGQYLLVMPSHRLVVVRMREPKKSSDQEENVKYGFRQLVRMTLALVDE